MNNEKGIGIIAIVHAMMWGSLAVSGQTFAGPAIQAVGAAGTKGMPQQVENIPFEAVPEPEGGKTIDYPLDRAIQDADRWAEFWNEIHPGEPVPTIDFGKRMVVVTALGGGTATSGIEVTNVTKSLPGQPPLIKIHIKETRPGPNCIIPMIYAPPPHVLIVTENGGNVTFRRKSEYRYCN
ncbi:hypothetical protein ACWJKU_15090 [Methylocaldum sp. MU1018]|jgi:hypothetical protein